MVAEVPTTAAPNARILLALVPLGVLLWAGVAAATFTVLTTAGTPSGCAPTGSPAAGRIVLGPPGSGQTVGASEYGGPGDPSSGVVGSSGANLLADPDSYAELGGLSFGTAVALGGLAYGTPLRITWERHSAIAYKRDIGLGGGPIDGLPRVIDLWWELAGRLGIPYQDGRWSGPVRVERTPATGAAAQLGDQTAAGSAVRSAPPAEDVALDESGAPGCSSPGQAALPLAPGSRAGLLAGGLAAAPIDAPAAVRAMIAAGNQIAGKPYVYGAGHGLPLSQIAPAYDCSSSVDHILYGAGLLAAGDTEASGQLESFGLPGPGRWVTIYASASHVFMYVAGLRWDTHNAAGPEDGSAGIGWHPLVRDAAGFVVRHPAGL
jgi:hypothetical protein